MSKKDAFKQKLNMAKRKVSDVNVGYATLNIEYLMKLIRTKKQENPNLSIPIMMLQIEKSYRDVAFSTSDNAKIVTRSDFCLLRTLMYIKKHPEIIFKTIDESDRSSLLIKKSYFRYTPDIKECITELMNDACSNIVGRQDFSSKMRFIKGNMSVKERISMQKEILEMISNYQKRLEREMKSSYTISITEIAKVLEENGCFEKNIERHNRRLRMLGLDEFQEKDSERKSKPSTIISMADWKNPDIVEKLPLEVLIMASAFFTNRICKEYIAFKKSTFLMEELKISEEDAFNKGFEIPREIFSALIKYEFLQTEARQKFLELKRTKKNSSSAKIDYVSYDLNYEQEEYEEYKRYFDEIIPGGSNNLLVDYERFMQFDNVMEILYQKKDMALDSLIMFFSDKKTKVNWGYVEEKTEQGNSIGRNKAMVALGFDLEKFNTSVRLHKSLSELRNLIRQCTGEDVIPVYNGEEDWFVKDKFGILTDMNTQVFRMLDSQERKRLKEKSSTLSPEDRLYGFVSHLNWIANGATPPKHKKRNIVDLCTGKVEELDEKLK